MKKIFSVRGILGLFLLLATIYASVATYYKIKHWGFSYKPTERSDVWTVDAHISFQPIAGQPIEVSLASPSVGQKYKILSEDVVAQGYTSEKNVKNNRIIMKSKPRKNVQDLYYRIMLYDNADTKGKIYETAPKKVEKPKFEDEYQEGQIMDLLALADRKEGSSPQRIIRLLNEEPLQPEVDAFLPVKRTQQIMAEKIIYLLAVKGITARVVRGVKLSENKRSTPADLMVEAYEGSKWIPYNITTGKAGLPKDFITFQRGGVSLLDVTGGENSQIRFSVVKSVISSFKMAGRRAKYEDSRLFDYTIYNLPSLEQNVLKWLMIFPLGIMLVVILRNIIGIQTMGTFTPMLIAMSLVKTGFVSGFICFTLIVGFGLLIRGWLTRLNLLLVPRISAVVIFVIVIMQMLTIFGYQLDYKILATAAFFPIIITAWIIERASITWEEEGARNATKQIVNTLLVAVVTYFVISSTYIRHIMFAFNEWNIVILAIVMLLGTYTGYRLSELKRFAPLTKEK
ncbi:MAG: UUP1 family membrane protein [Alphaproteobacteria bacterium]|nr:UUP1 family membrane protein [Alphaproteobacteria bacterium]